MSGRVRGFCALAALSSLACGGAARLGSEQDHATLTFPNEPERQSPAPASSATPSAGGSAAPTAPSPASDPPMLRSTEHWRLGLQYVRGVIRVAQVEQLQLQEPSEGDRRTGRFALELWSNQTLLDRLRFDFPLLAAETPQSEQRPIRREAVFAPGAEVSTSLQIPSVREINRAQIVDRATGQITPVAWPPQPSTPEPDGALGAK